MCDTNKPTSHVFNECNECNKDTNKHGACNNGPYPAGKCNNCTCGASDKGDKGDKDLTPGQKKMRAAWARIGSGTVPYKEPSYTVPDLHVGETPAKRVPSIESLKKLNAGPNTHTCNTCKYPSNECHCADQLASRCNKATCNIDITSKDTIDTMSIDTPVLAGLAKKDAEVANMFKNLESQPIIRGNEVFSHTGEFIGTLQEERREQKKNVGSKDNPTGDVLPVVCTSSFGSPVIKTRPIFAVSDLHIGDHGPRDNFWYADGLYREGYEEYSSSVRMRQFKLFLKYVRSMDGRLIILGDLLDFWQANLSKVITANEELLGELYEMGAIYILGNHDCDLRHFIRKPGPPKSQWLGHPFFDTMRESHTENIGGKLIHFTHGHQVDEYCVSDSPGIGRATAIYTGIKEDKNGGPILGKYMTVEQKYLGKMERALRLFKRMTFQHVENRQAAMNRKLVDLRLSGPFSAVISGHTHEAGLAGSACYNTGTWAEKTNSYVYVDPTGDIKMFDWLGVFGIEHHRELPV